MRTCQCHFKMAGICISLPFGEVWRYCIISKFPTRIVKVHLHWRIVFAKKASNSHYDSLDSIGNAKKEIKNARNNCCKCFGFINSATTK